MNYSENRFRRFAYFLDIDIHKVPMDFQIAELNRLESLSHRSTEILKGVGYRKDHWYFFIFDVVPTFRDDDIRAILASGPKMTGSGSFKGFWQKASPLERIYELDQRVDYGPEEGQLKTKTSFCKRFVWTLLLQESPTLIEEYKRVHGIGAAWPEITDNMKQVGVKDMEIYLHRSQAILVMDTIPDFNMEKVAPVWQSLPRENEWQAYVSKFQRVVPGSSIKEKWQDMIPVF